MDKVVYAVMLRLQGSEDWWELCVCHSSEALADVIACLCPDSTEGTWPGKILVERRVTLGSA